MKTLYHRLLLVIAGATQKELAKYVRYLKTEDQMLRSKLPRRVPVTEKEKAKLVKFGSRLGGALEDLVTIVHPDTLPLDSRVEASEKEADIGRQEGSAQNEGRFPPVDRQTRPREQLGLHPYHGRTQKLGITPPSRNTVKNILREHDLDPGPQRGEGTWDEFLKVHAATLWQCDFYAKRVLTMKGWKELYLLVFLHVGTRRVFIAPSTFHPNDAWVNEQGEAFLKHAADAGLGAKIVMHDRDTKFTKSFDQKLKDAGVKIRKTAYRSPNTNAYVERFLQTLQQEALDHFIVFGQQHLDVIVSEFVQHYHEERPHQGMDNDVLVAGETPSTKSADEDPPRDVVPVSQIACRERLGGVLKHYYRKAA
ncbi:MAG: integrase core domain-containing protein [Pirellulales bacterium]